MSTHEPPTATSPSPELRLGGPSEPDVDRWQAIADRAKRLYGAVPETLRVMAIGSNAAELYLALSEANDDSTLSTLEREYVAIQTARSNGCHYCLTAHLARALLLGADPDALNGLGSHSLGSRTDAVLAFAASVLDRSGTVPDALITATRAAGLDDRTLVDIVSVVTENALGNSINNLAGTPPEPGVQRFLARKGVIVPAIESDTGP